MGQSLSDAAKKTIVAQIVQTGEKMILPEGVSLEEAKDLIERRIAFESEKAVISETFDVFPWDGAYSLNKVLNEQYGWAQAIATPGFFGDTPPQLQVIETGPKQVEKVPWGRFVIPNVKGFLQTGATKKDGRYVFVLNATMVRRDEARVQRLFDALREEVKVSSIYRGKAIKLRFKTDDGEKDQMPEPKFLDTDKVDPRMLVFSDDVMKAIMTNLFTPIMRVRDLLANDIPVKRGVLLGGTFGTGKTMAAAVASKLAVQAGVTYIYVPRADELKDAIEFAKQYQSPAAVIFCEDIDRVMAGGRSVKMDDILNTIDGIDSKTSNIIVVLTTNNLKEIHPAMLRPGRLDAVIETTPPDGKAVERLIRLYADGRVKDSTNLERVGKVLEGNIPAVIQEVVKRAKLSQLSIQAVDERLVKELTEDALLEAAKTMGHQIEILQAATRAPVPEPDHVGGAIAKVVDEVIQSNPTLARVKKDAGAVKAAIGA